MTAIADRVTTPPAQRPAPGPASRFGWAVSDTLTIARRNLLIWFRVPAYVAFTMVPPVKFVLLFTFVFGGAIMVRGPGGYIGFLVPGIIVQAASFATFGTGIALARELKKGVIDRFRSMPMARSAVLGGRLVADLGRILITSLIIIAVGYAVGFRFTNGVVPAIAMVVLAAVFAFAVSAVAAYTGLALGEEESVQALAMIWVFLFTFVSSAFVPVRTMPGWLQVFAANQPFTNVIDTMRALALGGPVETNLLKSIGWIVVICLVFLPLAVRSYKKAS